MLLLFSSDFSKDFCIKYSSCYSILLFWLAIRLGEDLGDEETIIPFFYWHSFLAK